MKRPSDRQMNKAILASREQRLRGVARTPLTVGARPKQCQWIQNEPTANDSCKCGARTVAESSYCAEHEARAHPMRAAK